MVDFSNKIAIIEYKWKYAIYALLCWVIAAIGFFRVNGTTLGFQYTIVLLVISALAIYLTVAILHPKFVFIGRKGPLYNDFINYKHFQMVHTSNSFVFNNEGFQANVDSYKGFVRWDEISQIELTLEDSLPNDDEVVLTIHFGQNQNLSIDEESNGWLYFTETLPKYLTEIPENWLDDFIRSGNTRLQLWAA